MKFVSDIINKKKGFWSVRSKDTVHDAVALLKEKDVGALIVRDDKDKVVGIISERDLVRKLALEGKATAGTLVQKIMTPLKNMFTVKPENTVDECMVIMTGKHVRHLPVFDGSNFVGIVSIGDIVKAKISEQEFLIEQLSNYIAGRYAT